MRIRIDTGRAGPKRAAALLALGFVLAGGASFVRAQPQPRELSWSAKVHPRVLAAPAETEQELLIVLADQADLSAARDLPTKEEKGRYVFERLTETARRSQGVLLAELEARGVPYQSFWITNMVLVRGRGDLVEAMARRPDVARVEPNPALPLRSPVPELQAPAPESPPEPPSQLAIATEWNIAKVGAPQVWAAGFTGQGVVVAGADTGYDWTHPALKGKYRGWNGTTANHSYNWHDAVHNAGTGNSCGSNAPAPCDDDSHGTHTMGIMVGEGGTANQIGMAPGAKWIGCRNMDQGTGTPARYTECFQWFLAPTDSSGANPDPSKAPDVINNSWSCPTSEGCTSPDTLKSIVESVRAAGIAVVVAAGNAGPGCGTTNEIPEGYEASISVGATNSSDAVTSYSSRGPGQGGILKPDLVAPGSGIRSSVPGGGYASMSGTSMASPHVAGLTALLLSASPSLSGNVTGLEVLMEQTAVAKTTTETCGGIAAGAVPNDTAGYGRIDALAAYDAAVAPNTPPSVSLTSPVAGAVFTAPATIAIAATASDTGKVARIDLYAGTTKLATFTSAPYSFTWSGVAAGAYTLTAVATDNQGASKTSAPVSITVGTGGSSIPGPWAQKDIGAVGLAGGSSYSNGVFSVTGSGTDVWSTSDQFHFVYQPLSGDGQIVARVVSVQNTGIWAKAGVMIRETLAAGSAYAYMLVSPSNGAAFQRRLSTGGKAVGTTVTGISAPYWVKLVRSGSTFSAYSSPDGVNWTLVGSAAIPMASGVFIGLAVTSHNNASLCTATLDSVTIPSSWANVDIGAVGIAGSGSTSSGAFTVAGSGSDIWSTSDQFHFMYQPLSGDGQIVARVVSVQNTYIWAKAGVMIRETLAAGSAYAYMLVSPSSGAAFQRRPSTGGKAVGTTVTGIAAPYWVKLARSANTFSAYSSPDGVNWTLVGSAVSPMASGVSIGLAVTSHNNAALCTAALDNVSKTP